MPANRPLPRRARLLAGAALVAGLVAPAHAQRGVQAVPTPVAGGTAPGFTIGQPNVAGGLTDTVTVNTSELIIDWAPLDTGVGGGAIDLLPTNNRLAFEGAVGLADYTVLNRVVPVDPTRAVAINGAVTSLVNVSGANVQGGAVWFYTPGGFILGSTAQFDVGSLVLSASPIDTSGGLFGAGNAIRFGQAPNSGAGVVIQPGARINVSRPAGSATGAYLAVVAPRITQGGAATIDGSTAYLAAEAATVRIDAGLFDITFTTGTDAANPIVHSGTTTGPAVPLGRNDNIVVAALAKNTALTMLLGGNLGYSATGATTTDNGAIVLSGGNASVSSQFGAGAPTGAAVGMSIGSSAFSSALTATATGAIAISPDGGTQSIAFDRSASLTGGAGVTATIDAGETLTIGNSPGGLSLLGQAPGGAGNLARVTVAAGGAIAGGALTISADGNGTGGTAELAVQGSAAIGALLVSADGVGGDGASGQVGTGGTATVSVIGTGASLRVTNLALSAVGAGGESTGTGGIGALGRGGTAQLTVTGGTLQIDTGNGPGDLLLDVRGIGGFGLGASGAGQGGTANLALTDATVGLANIDVDASGATIDSVESGYGFDTSRSGGTATGGIVTFALTRTDLDPTTVEIVADANGGDGSIDLAGLAGDGGSATGGTITATLVEASLTPSFFTATADAIGGSGAAGRNGGSGNGGTVAFTTTSSTTIASTDFRLSATGDGGIGDLSGNAIGGSAIATINGGSFSVGESFAISAGGGGLFDAGDPAASAGGIGRGGTAALRFTGGTGDLAEIGIDASGRGGDAVGQGGDGFGGTAELSITGGADVRSGSDVSLTALARGGSASDIVSTGGDATGGTATLSIAGASLVVEGDLLSLDASATAGFSFGGTPPVARGGTIGFGLTQGQAGDPAPSLTAFAIEAIARGAIFNINETGLAAGNAGTGIGGRIVGTIAAGTLTGTTFLFDASGTGGTSPDGATGGRGYGGRAALDMTGGAVTVDRLDIFANAQGGLGTAGSDETGPAGNGGAAGTGTNPFGPDAGAFASISGGTLSANQIGIRADAEGGFGGSSISSYGDPVPAGRGGDARGGIAFFRSTGAAVIDTFNVDVSANANGGFGGQAETFSGGPLLSTGGDGGTALGGSARLDLGGTTGSPGLSARANARGGNGGASVNPFGSPPAPGSTATGGRGGDGTGGSAAVTLSAAADPFVITNAEAEGRGGDGSNGPAGGAGGVGRGGDAVATLDGLGVAIEYRLSSAFARARGSGGRGGDSDGLAAGDGGDGFGGTARYEVLNGVTALLSGPTVEAGAAGGNGGNGGDSVNGNFGRGGDGGRGGNATGGDAELYIALAGATLFAGEGAPPAPSASAFAGAGGSGGLSDIGLGGSGGAGGSALGGVSRLRLEGGAVTTSSYRPLVLARGGQGGGGNLGPGGIGADGAGGSATGGDIAILASDVVELGAVSNGQLGVGTLTTLGEVAFDATAVPGAGTITIVDDSARADGSLTFTSLAASAGSTPANGGSISLFSRASPIVVTGSASFTAGGDIDMSFAGSGGIRAGGAVELTSGGAIRIAHLGQAATPAASIAGLDVTLLAGTDLLATGGSLIDGTAVVADAATGNLVLAGARSGSFVRAAAAGDATVGGVSAQTLDLTAGASLGGNSVPGATAALTGNVTVSDGIAVTAPGDVVVASGAQVTADRRIEFTAGDDIRIGTGARVRAANNPPPESGAGATDPLLQAAQLRLVAGGFAGGTRPAGDIASIVLDGTLEAPARTVFLSGQAIAGSAGSVVSSGNLFARVVDAPAIGAPASNDVGQLPTGCVEGNVCLGRVLVSNIVRIGETGFIPNAVRLVGGIDAVDVLLRARGTLSLSATGASDFIRASSSLTIASTGGDILADGTLAISSGGALSLAAARDVSAPGLTLQVPGTLALFAGRDLTLGGLDAAQVQTIDTNGNVIRANGIEAAGAIRVTGTARVTNGDLIARAGTGLDLGTVAAPGRNIDLASTTGLVRLANATATNVTLAGADASLGAVDASGALAVSARGEITVTGATRGGTIAFTSGDLAIAAGAQLGSATTSAITLTSNTGSAALGGSEGNGVWRLTDAELDRIRSSGDLTISAPPTGQGGGAFTLIDPASASLLIDGISLSGQQFGANGTLRFSARSIGIVGQAQIDGIGSGQSIFLSASQDIALAAETGGLALRDAAGGLAGTLRLEANQIHALTSGARGAAATLDLPALSTRLATQDGIVRDGGYFQAGGLVARVARAFLVQNSGATSDVQDDRRGLSVGTGGLRIEATGNAPASIAINGRILATAGAITGPDVIPATTIAGTLDPQSTINGCLIADPSSCTPSRPRAPIDIALNVSRDVITEEVAETVEEAARKGQGATKLPQVLVEILEVPPRPYDPVIDEPVTGTGNDDLWEQTPSGPPGG